MRDVRYVMKLFLALAAWSKRSEVARAMNTLVGLYVDRALLVNGVIETVEEA